MAIFKRIVYMLHILKRTVSWVRALNRVTITIPHMTPVLFVSRVIYLSCENLFHTRAKINMFKLNYIMKLLFVVQLKKRGHFDENMINFRVHLPTPLQLTMNNKSCDISISTHLWFAIFIV